MATLIDANVALRYLLEDNDEQAQLAAQAIASGAEITVEVLAECVYVLSGVYGVPRSMIAESLGLLLDDVECRRRGIAASALGLYSGSRLDFVDCLLLAENLENGREILTFDKKLSRRLVPMEKRSG